MILSAFYTNACRLRYGGSVNTAAYVAGLQPCRAICYGIGVRCMRGMIVQILAQAG